MGNYVPICSVVNCISEEPCVFLCYCGDAKDLTTLETWRYWGSPLMLLKQFRKFFPNLSASKSPKNYKCQTIPHQNSRMPSPCLASFIEVFLFEEIVCTKFSLIIPRLSESCVTSSMFWSDTRIIFVTNSFCVLMPDVDIFSKLGLLAKRN